MGRGCGSSLHMEKATNAAVISKISLSCNFQSSEEISSKESKMKKSSSIQCMFVAHFKRVVFVVATAAFFVGVHDGNGYSPSA